MAVCNANTFKVSFPLAHIEQYDDITQAFERLTKSGPRLAQTRLLNPNRTAGIEKMTLKESPLPEDLVKRILLVSRRVA